MVLNSWRRETAGLGLVKGRSYHTKLQRQRWLFTAIARASRGVGRPCPGWHPRPSHLVFSSYVTPSREKSSTHTITRARVLRPGWALLLAFRPLCAWQNITGHSRGLGITQGWCAGGQFLPLLGWGVVSKQKEPDIHFLIPSQVRPPAEFKHTIQRRKRISLGFSHLRRAKREELIMKAGAPGLPATAGCRLKWRRQCPAEFKSRSESGVVESDNPVCDSVRQEMQYGGLTMSRVAWACSPKWVVNFTES